MTRHPIAYSTTHPRIRAVGFCPPSRPALQIATIAMRRAADGPHRGDPDRLPRWG